MIKPVLLILVIIVSSVSWYIYLSDSLVYVATSDLSHTVLLKQVAKHD